jgi:hypothetical protein
MSLSPPLPPFNSSDPTATFLSSSTLDFLLIELVPLALRVTADRDFASPAATSSNSTADALQSPPHSAATAKSEATSGTVVGDAAGDTPKRIDDEEHLDAVHYRLEAQGYRVGQGLVERYMTSFSRKHTSSLQRSNS